MCSAPCLAEAGPSSTPGTDPTRLSEVQIPALRPAERPEKPFLTPITTYPNISEFMPRTLDDPGSLE